MCPSISCVYAELDSSLAVEKIQVDSLLGLAVNASIMWISTSLLKFFQLCKHAISAFIL